MKYIHEAFEVKEMCLGGHSGGGVIALAVTEMASYLMPDLKVKAVRLASSVLSTKDWYVRQWGHSFPLESWVTRQYNPTDHIQKLPPGTNIIFVHDREDPVTTPVGFEKYIHRAKEIGLELKFVEVDVKAFPPHITDRALGVELRKRENDKYRCAP